MSKIFKGFALAFSMLSLIPFFKVHNFYKGINGYAAMFYPLVGFFLGLILYIIYFLLSPYTPHNHLSIIIFFLLILITGAIHLDGFSDTIDGLFVNKDKALKVMKDPNTGGMGMIFSVTFLILKASSLSYINSMYLLPIIMMLSRLNASLAIYFSPYISKGGIASLAKEEFNYSMLVITIIYVVIILILFQTYILMTFSLLVLFLLRLFFIKRYGGFTGDIYGFIIEVTELVLLNILIFGFDI